MTMQEIYEQLQELVRRHGGDFRVRYDPDRQTVCVYGPEVTPLARARTGAEDIAELAQDTSEHHPYWKILYDCSQISAVVLERWNDDLTDGDLEEMKWSVDRLADSIADQQSKQR